ncbi:MAG: hypothetical protein OXI03_01100 [Chloroflexota bacterium]|nr:hypothetical protein [Chloroflexota bacterium]
MSDSATRVPRAEKVRLRKLKTPDGTVHVGLEIEYRSTEGGPVRLQIGLSPEQAAELGAHLAQLAEKLQSTEH